MEKENLRPEDLMVGDWVLLFDKTPVKVDCIGNVEVYLSEPNGQDWRVTYEHIKPIPLTKEILEKNEFRMNKKDGLFTRFVFADNLVDFPRTVIEFSFFGKGVSADTVYKCWTKPKDCDVENIIHLCNLKYYHELQHALRLCRINKEIVL